MRSVKKIVTIRDVAGRAGVSPATVSKYLNGITIRKKNAQAIEDAIRALNFIPNEVARGLRTNRTKTVGVLLPELDNLFMTRIISGVELVLERHGYSTIVCSCHSDTEREQKRLAFLRRKQIDGLIAVPVSTASGFIASLDGLPTVFIDRVVDTAIQGGHCTSVLSDNFSATYTATRELLKAGHRKIGLLLGSDSFYTPVERRAGFLAAFRTHGIVPEESYLRVGDYTREAGYRLTNELLDLPDPPTALFPTNNELTIGAMKALSERGLTAGKDISFLGFDNRDLAEISRPKLTVVLQPVDEIGRVAAETLIRMIGGEKGGQIIHLPTKLLSGASVTKIEKHQN